MPTKTIKRFQVGLVGLAIIAASASLAPTDLIATQGQILKGLVGKEGGPVPQKVVVFSGPNTQILDPSKGQGWGAQTRWQLQCLGTDGYPWGGNNVYELFRNKPAPALPEYTEKATQFSSGHRGSTWFPSDRPYPSHLFADYVGVQLSSDPVITAGYTNSAYRNQQDPLCFSITQQSWNIDYWLEPGSQVGLNSLALYYHHTTRQ